MGFPRQKYWSGLPFPSGSQRVRHDWATKHSTAYTTGLPWWLSGKESACNTGGVGSMPRLARSLGGGNDNSLQYSCLGNPMNRGALQATVHGVSKESDTNDWLDNKPRISTVPGLSSPPSPRLPPSPTSASPPCDPASRILKGRERPAPEAPV